MMAESGTDVSDISVADRSAVTVAKIVGEKFGDETQQVLKLLYKRGMTGGGKKHSAFLDFVENAVCLYVTRVTPTLTAF